MRKVSGILHNPAPEPANDVGSGEQGGKRGTDTGQGQGSQPVVSMPRTQAFEHLGYTPAEAHFNETTYVDYYVRDPLTKGKRRMRIKLNSVPAGQRKAYARRLVMELNQKLGMGWNPLVSGDAARAHVSMAEALDTYVAVKCRDTQHSSPKTYSSFASVVREWCRAECLLDKAASVFNRTHVIRFLDHLLEVRHVGNNTYNNYILRCSILFGWMVEREYRSDNPFKGVKRRRKVEKFRTLILADERATCLDWFHRHDPPMVMVCLWVFHTLLRPRSELLRIRVQDVDVENGVVNVDGRVSKSSRIRRPAIPDVMLPYIVASPLMQAKPGHFVVGKGLLPGPEKSGHNTVGNRWNAMRKALGWGADKELYSLRDSGIVQLIADGLDLHFVMRQAGHKDIATTNRYVQHYFPNGLEEVRRKATRFTGLSSFSTVRDEGADVPDPIGRP